MLGLAPCRGGLAGTRQQFVGIHPVLAQTDALVAAVGVAGVGDRWLSTGADGRRQLVSRHVEERAQQPRPGRLALPCHAGQPAVAAARGQPQGHRLGLVVAMMSQQQVEDAFGAAGGDEQFVADVPRRLLDAGGGPGP